MFSPLKFAPSNNNSRYSSNRKSFGDELTRKAFSNGIRERKREKIFSIRSYNKQDEKCGERERYRENWRTMDWNKFCYGIWIWLLSVFTTHTHMPILHIQHYHGIHYLCAKSCYDTVFPVLNNKKNWDREIEASEVGWQHENQERNDERYIWSDKMRMSDCISLFFDSAVQMCNGKKKKEKK